MGCLNTLALRSRKVGDQRVLTGIRPYRPLCAFHEHTLAHHTNLSNNFAQLEAAMSLQLVCMAGVMAECHQLVSR